MVSKNAVIEYPVKNVLHTLTPATELKVLTEANEMVFKENVLKSKAYSRLLGVITDRSLEGRYTAKFELFEDEDEYTLDVIIDVLKHVGYTVVRHHHSPTLLISWG